MNEKYLKDLYGWITQNDSTYGNDVPYDSFIQKMQDPSYAQQMHKWVGSIDPSFTKDVPIESFMSKIKASEPSVEKKNSVATGSSSEGASLASSSQGTEDDGILSKIGNAALKAQSYTMLGVKKTTDALSGIASSILSEGFLKPVDDIFNAYKNQLAESNFFGEDIPNTDKPASDAIKKQLEQLSKKKEGDMSPIDPRAILQGISRVSSLVINSVLPQEEKNKVIARLVNASSNTRDQIKYIEDYQQRVAPEGVMKVPYEITKNIAGMIPDLALAAEMKSPQYAESAAAKWADITTKKAAPIIEKYSPKAAKVVEKYLPKTTKLATESVTSPFTKIMATKGAIKGMAETKEGEDPYINSLYGAVEGATQGAYMHVLGVTSAEVSPVISKLISKTGLNSAIATAIANPLANAGVFTSAKALRVAAEEQRALTPEEIVTEAGTGAGFSLLHIGSIYKNQNEANHYYDNVLKDNPIDILGRVINETKANLDIAYDPNLTKDDVEAMMSARDEIKKAILKEPDMQKKKALGDEAIKLQNKIDAHNAIDDIVENRDALIDLINNNRSLGENEKKRISNKISAIADAYDMSEFGVRKRELNAEIIKLNSELSDLSEKFTDSKLPSERAALKAFIDAKKQKLGELNNELTNLVTNKQKENAVQKQESDESLLRAGEQKLGLQQVGKGNAELELTPEQEQAISDEKDAFQEILDNPDNHDEADVQEAKDYFADPLKYYEEKIKFYEDEANPTEDDKAALEHFKSMLEAHKALKPETKTESTTIQAVGGATVSESTPEVKSNLPKNFQDEIDRDIEYYSKKLKESQDKNDNWDIQYYTEEIDKLKSNPVDYLLEGYKRSLEDSENKLNDINKNKVKKFFTKGADSRAKYLENTIKQYKQEIDELTKINTKEAKPAETKTAAEPTETKTSEVDIEAKKADIEKRRQEELKNIPLAEKYDNTNNGSISETIPGDKFGNTRQKYIPFNIIEEALKNDRLGGQTAKQISDRGGYSDKELDRHLPNWRSMLPEAKDINAKYDAELKALEESKPSETKTAAEPTGVKPAEGTITIGAGGATGISEGGTTGVSKGAEGTETATGGEDIYYKNGKLKGNYIKQQLGNALKTMSFRKFGDLYRKHFDKFFTREDNSRRLTGNFTFRELANYIISDEYFDYEDSEAKFRAFAKDAGIEIPEIKSGTTTLSEGKPTDVTMTEAPETKTSTVDVKGLTGYDNLMGDIDLLVPKYKEYVDRDYVKARDRYRLNKTEANKKALEKAKAEREEYKADVENGKKKAIESLENSDVYKIADDMQKDALMKEVVRKFGERVKKAPSAETILGIEPSKVVTMTEKAALNEQIKAFNRGVKEGLKTAKDLMERRRVLAAAIKQIEKSGLISASKVNNLLNKISKVNLQDDAAVEKVIEHAEKIFEDAEYENKLANANSIRAEIKKLAASKNKNVDLSVFAKKFFKIRPSDVDNIDEYNEMANKVKESLQGSKITKDKNNPIKIADMIDIAKMNDYVDNRLDEQSKIDSDKLVKWARGIMGDDATFLSDDEIIQLVKTGQVEGNEKVDDSLVKKITERVDKIFESSTAMVNEILRTGKDPLTGEDIDLSEGRKKIVERFMSMDMKDLSDREKLGVIDALNNFIRNGSVANMETVYADYKAKDNLAKAIENNVVAKKLKLFFSKKTGRAFGQQISTLPNLTEQMFRGVAASEEFKRLSGITKVLNQKAGVERQMDVLTDSFVKEFYNKKANGKDFDTAENVAERAAIADMKRDIIGTPEQQKYEFERKKKIAEKSIELLRSGTEQEQKLADIHQKVYDKILKDSNTIEDVLKKSDDKNVEAVDWWIDKWSDIYDPLADVSESIYNKKLDRDLNYTNRRYSLLSGAEKAPEISSRESIFHGGNNDIFGKGVYKKKAGVLEKSTRPEAEGLKDRYIDWSFDRNMINAYRDALMDINTAATVRQIESFFNSDAIKKIIPNKEDRDLLFKNGGKEGIVPDLIRASRQRQVVNTDELSSVFRKLSNLGTAGAATALAGVKQPFVQTIPVAVNTFINAGKLPDFFYFRNKDKVDFINNSQRGIAIRGSKSRVNVDSINKLAEAASTSKASKVIDLLGKSNEIALKYLVEKPDVWIAKASWITYYEKGLEKQGKDPKKINWKKHKLNEEAADYAQDMVDRQQNISDADLQGKLMNTKDPFKSVMVKAIMPFASFRMNQTMRMYSDWKTMFSKKGSATKEDRITAFKSLSGYIAEMATFKYMQYLAASWLANAAVKAMGINETDDDKKKREEMLSRSQTTGTVTDILSPLPMLDLPVAIGTDKALSLIQDLENIDDEDKFNLMTSFKRNGAKSLGLYGIAADKATSILEAFDIATSKEFTDEYGRKKYVSAKTANALGDVALASLGSSVIGFPAEMNSILRNSLRLAKKNSSTKEGGREASVRQSEEKRAEAMNKKESKMKEEVQALNSMLEEETDAEKIKEIRKMIREAKEAPYKGKEQKEEEKLTRKEEKEKLEEMLQGYDSKSDMKRYDPDLYEKTFGEGSDYYEENNTEKEVKSDLSKEKRQIKDEEYDYSKRKKRRKNKDGSYKKSYYRSYIKY